MAALRIRSGTVRGRAVPTPSGEAEAFLGIPYAAHAGRFRPPGPPPRLREELDAGGYGPACPQGEPPAGTAEDGCLNLCVWRPAPAPADEGPLPVLVWIHGGAHLHGTNADPVTAAARLAARHRVIVVAPNYRLGALGHLTLDHLLGPAYRAASNAALLDLAAALEWVREEAGALGGDPGNVTVFGQSAGGANTAALLALPRARGLFRRAVVQSGTGDRAQSHGFGAERTAELLSLCGLSERRAGELLTLPVDRLVAAQEELVRRRNPHRPDLAIAFQPTLDPEILPSRPVDALASGASADVDLVVGTNVNEASGYLPLDTPDAAAAGLVERLAAADFPAVPGLAAQLPGRLAELLGRAPRPAELAEAYLAEQIYREPSQRLLDARRTASGRTYAYLFTWSAPHNRRERGTPHSAELPFLFRNLHLPEARDAVGGAPPQELADTLGACWTSFARTGVPTGPGLPVWPEYGPERRSTAVLDAPPRIADDPRRPVRTLLAGGRG